MNFKKVCLISAFFIFFLYAILILSLFYFFKPSLIGLLFSERTLFSIRTSIMSATIATILSVLIAIPAAYALSRFNFKGKQIIDTILEFPMIISPAALGAALLIFFNNPLGEWIQANLVQFVFTIYGIILAQFITTVGISTRLIKSVMDEIPEKYEAVAKTLGASPFKAFLTITFPMCKNGIIAAAILTWAKALGEFGATITIAGSMPMKTETLPIAIYMKLSVADIEGTVILILILILTGLIILYAIKLIINNMNYA